MAALGDMSLREEERHHPPREVTHIGKIPWEGPFELIVMHCGRRWCGISFRQWLAGCDDEPRYKADGKQLTPEHAEVIHLCDLARNRPGDVVMLHLRFGPRYSSQTQQRVAALSRQWWWPPRAPAP